MRFRGQDLERLLVLLVEDSGRGARMRNGVGWGAAGLLVVVGLLAADGEGAVAVALAASALIVGGVSAGAGFWRRRRLGLRGPAAVEDAPTLEQSWPLRPEAELQVPQAAMAPTAGRGAVTEDASRSALAAWRKLEPAVRGLAALSRATATRLRIALRPLLPYTRSAGNRLTRLLPSLQRLIGQAALDAGLPPSRARDDEVLAARLARDRSALGSELRRVGEPAQAAEEHRTARALYAAAGNRRGEALATNSLALALAAAGDKQAALEELERARALLHALGDEEREAKVLANIGVVRRRAGALDEAAQALEAALTKLPPQTPAYRLVERQLRRAG